jgi:hypothetical protein
MHQTIEKNKWEVYANCKYMQNIFVPPFPLVASQEPLLRPANSTDRMGADRSTTTRLEIFFSRFRSPLSIVNRCLHVVVDRLTNVSTC